MLDILGWHHPCCVFLYKVLIIWPNTIYRSSTTVFYHTLRYFFRLSRSATSGRFGYTKRNIKGERCLFTMLWITTIFNNIVNAMNDKKYYSIFWIIFLSFITLWREASLHLYISFCVLSDISLMMADLNSQNIL